jgi:hypothetical protein
MEPIESIGREAQALVAKAEKEAEEAMAEPEPVESRETARSEQKV